MSNRKTITLDELKAAVDGDSRYSKWFDVTQERIDQFADVTELRGMLEAAKKVWALVSFLSWQHALQNQNDARAVSYNYALPAILRRFADDQGQ